MTDAGPLHLDALIFGGGAAGLWLLHELRRRGFSCLLIESRALGAGQTIASQGILHGGLKYSLRGLISPSAQMVSEMPSVWHSCLTGERSPDLRDVRVLSPCCFLWRTDSVASRLGLLGAKVGLRTPVQTVERTHRPEALRGAPGEVLRVDEPVIDASSLLSVLADAHRLWIILVQDPCDITLSARGPGEVDGIALRHPPTDETVSLRPRFVVLTAGEGNDKLRQALGLSREVMQRRPLHMVLVRGALPALFGHCVDGDRTRVTTTSAVDSAGRTVWHMGGELAERGVEMNEADLITQAQRELSAVLPGVDLRGAQWASYRIDRAEGRTSVGTRPDGPVWRREGNVITAWPTKLVLAPRLAEMIADEVGDPQLRDGTEALARLDFPRPAVAAPPWEVNQRWHS